MEVEACSRRPALPACCHSDATEPAPSHSCISAAPTSACKWADALVLAYVQATVSACWMLHTLAGSAGCLWQRMQEAWVQLRIGLVRGNAAPDTLSSSFTCMQMDCSFAGRHMIV